jgi:hypothetical protein
MLYLTVQHLQKLHFNPLSEGKATNTEVNFVILVYHMLIEIDLHSFHRFSEVLDPLAKAGLQF